MRITRIAVLFALAAGPLAFAAQPPAPPSGQPPQPGGRGGGRGRGSVPVMTLTTTAWPDGGTIPRRHTQAGEELSPPLSWSGAPDGVVSYVLIVHDVDAVIGNGTDDLLHWMLWNLPARVTSIPEGLPAAGELPDGTRQISATGPYYRGPCARKRAGAPLRVRPVRARHHARRAGGRRAAPADARGGDRRDGRPRPRQGVLRRPVQTLVICAG
jgi:phosphatidylethanolamine-binding protein (PEBP) family uncharacterized protein